MYAYKIKELAKRGTALLGAASLMAGIGTSALPVFVSADALNPLTERSLTLSSSSPGWSYLDGSGNTTYAPPNSGANGKQTGDTFSFKVSSTATVKGMSFQYCTTPAGFCYSPGNNGYNIGSPSPANDTRKADSASTSDLAVVDSSPSEISSGNWTTINARQSGVTPGLYAKTPKADNTEGNYIVFVNGTPNSGWTMNVTNDEHDTVTTRNTGDPSDLPTGKKNYITLTKGGGASLTAGDTIKVIFFATSSNYITNPGDGAFFVKINTYNDPSTLNDTTLVDGGVTVANVMNESISIQTKVLETMDFSVGTHDPDIYNAEDTTFQTNSGLSQHNQCDAILKKDPLSATYSTDPSNVLKLGNPSAEYSLSTSTPYEVSSYWRLSSNSSGGATVYYTGHTLTNTVGDEITPLADTAGMTTPAQVGTEQFGLGIDTGGSAPYSVDSDTNANRYTTGSLGTGTSAGYFQTYQTANSAKVHLPQLAPLVPTASYGSAAGTLVSGSGPEFAFNKDADSYAVPIASETTDVVDCVTAKMRYVANIAATTPAGIYTTKVNYVASPQY